MIINKLTFVICIINLDKNIWLVLICRTVTYNVLKWDRSESEKREQIDCKKCMANLPLSLNELDESEGLLCHSHGYTTHSDTYGYWIKSNYYYRIDICVDPYILF